MGEAVREFLQVIILLGLGVAFGMGIGAYHDVKEYYEPNREVNDGQE